jgi:hypothetical protein
VRPSSVTGLRYRAALPGARITVVGPLWSGETDEDGYRLRDALRDAAIATDVEYIDPVAGEWFPGPWGVGSQYVTADKVHLNDAGVQRLVEHLRVAL